jgi:hypothetical protein
MINSTIDQLRRENDDLRELIVRLSTIILQNIVGQRALPQAHSRLSLSSSTALMSPVEIVARMREVALLCAYLGRETAQELESLRIELADAAERVAAAFAIPDADDDGGAS